MGTVVEQASPIERFQVMWRDEVVADIEINHETEYVKVEKYDDSLLKQPFIMNGGEDTYKYIEEFLESRCFPRARDGAIRVLEELDVPYYEPRMIIQKTKGLVLEDFNWIRLEQDKGLTYDDIKVRNY